MPTSSAAPAGGAREASAPPGNPWLRGRRPFVAFGLATVAVAVALDLAAPAGRGFLVVTRANVDSICYFANAHSLLFDRDFDLTNQLARLLPTAKLSPGALAWLAPRPETGLPGTPYALGYSLLGLPALALGTGLDALAGRPADGWGPWAERCFAGANLLWLTLGLLAVRRWLVEVERAGGAEGDGGPGRALVATLALVPATALGYYTLTVMSHVAAFAAVAAFLLFSHRARASDRVIDWLPAGIAAGLVALCRWPDALMLAVPAFAELLAPDRLARWRRPEWWTSRLAAVATAAAIFAPQLLQWRAVYGRALLVPQGDSFFEWPPQHVLEVLFSSWNGLFFTTPATAVAALGLALAARRDPRRVLPPVLAAGLLTVALGAQTWNWHGFAFAQRLLIAALPVVALGWFQLLERGRRPRRLATAGVALGALFTLAAAVQWRFELVPRRDRLTFEEAFTDKLRLRQGLSRDRAQREALRVAEPAARAAALAAVGDRFGAGRVLLGHQAAALQAAGDAAGLEAATRRLDAMRARRLF